jgi:hypothetical protein
MSFPSSTILSAAPKIGSAFSAFKSTKALKKEKVEEVAIRIFSEEEKAIFLSNFETCKAVLIAKKQELNEASSAFEHAPSQSLFYAISQLGKELYALKERAKALFDQAYDAGCFPDCFDPKTDALPAIGAGAAVEVDGKSLNDID